MGLKNVQTAADSIRLTILFDRIQELADKLGVTFECEVGQKFIRIVQSTSNSGGRHVHAFVDITNGDLIKAAGWKAPAKGVNGLAVRGNLIDVTDFARILSVADRYGSYLYAR